MALNASMREYIDTVGARLVGRVFTYQDALHYVLAVNEETGLIRVSYRKDGETQQMDIPIGEVALRLAGTLQA